MKGTCLAWIAVAALVVAGGTALAAALPFVTVERGVGDAAACFGSGRQAEMPTLYAFTSATEFAAFWRTLHGNMVPLPPVPAVDFTRQVAVAVVDAARPTGGYALTIEEIAAGAATVQVTAVLTAPGEGCVTSQSPTRPFHLVTVARQEGKCFVLQCVKLTRSCLP